MDVKVLYDDIGSYVGKEVHLEGWIRNHRKQRSFGFVDFYDGTCFRNLQIVYNEDIDGFDGIQKIKIGAAIEVDGTVTASVGGGQDYEISAEKITLVGDSTDDFPIQPKRHSREFLREQSYLRPRTKLFQAVFQVRSAASMAIHTYLQERGYVYVHTPIFTDSDCEGAGEMFQATTLDLERIASGKDQTIDYTKDFFGKRVGLTVSGQFEGEAFAMAFKKIYTFGPTFRAENSNTKIHASEFWQIEPEIAFCDLNQLMEVEEEMLKFIIRYVIDHCRDAMEFLDQFVEKGLLNRLEKVYASKAVKVTHREAIDLLLQSGKKWEFEPKQGEDIAKEHERYLTEELFNSPVFVTDWPKDIKCFYMKINEDGKTVAAADFLVPGAGELMGGSQREDDYDTLVDIMNNREMNIDEIQWYVNLRKYGTCPHSGFGMGFERLLIYLTGMDNIRDVIPFPRTPNNCLY